MAANATSTRFAGPRDRESFFDAQRRNRRATWRLSVVSALATIVMGIPVALTITPLLYAAVMLIAEVVSLWMPLPPVFWRDTGALASMVCWLSHGSRSPAKSPTRCRL